MRFIPVLIALAVGIFVFVILGGPHAWIVSGHAGHPGKGTLITATLAGAAAACVTLVACGRLWLRSR